MLFATYCFVCHNVDRFAEKNHLQVDIRQISTSFLTDNISGERPFDEGWCFNSISCSFGCQKSDLFDINSVTEWGRFSPI